MPRMLHLSNLSSGASCRWSSGWAPKFRCRLSGMASTRAVAAGSWSISSRRACERSNALIHLRITDQTTGEEHYLDFGEPAYVAYTTTNVEFNTENLRFVYSSLTTPQSTIEYDMRTRERTVKKQQEVVGGHNPDDYITERIFATSRDGIKVPMSIVYKKTTKKSPEIKIRA